MEYIKISFTGSLIFLLLISSCTFKENNLNTQKENFAKDTNGKLNKYSKEAMEIDCGPRADTLTTEYLQDDTLLNTSFAKFLGKPINKENLKSDDKKGEIYKINWNCSFGSGGGEIKIKLVNNTVELFAKAYEPGLRSDGAYTLELHRQLPKARWDEFKLYIDTINFWHLPNKIIGNEGLDGSMWYMEGYNSGKYHMISRWTPPKDSKFFKCCLYLLKLSDVYDIDKIF